jgi:two-component system sensor histidine kinase KdpD
MENVDHAEASSETPATAGGRRGLLKVYLGAAPGVGKTYAMLGEGRRRASRGTDVAVGFVETYGRPFTQQAIGDLEVVSRARLTYRGAAFEEMDLDAVLARHPQVALIDELAHTNVPGSRNEKRWQDVEELLVAGIDVVSTLNIQHLESLNDVVERITGARQRETVPDEVVRATEQIELIDMTPEALRRRMAHGNIYRPEKVDAALGNYFRAGNLAALRELALLWIADQVDDALETYRGEHGIATPWETRERVVVAVTGAPGTEALIRRAARIAQRAHGDLVGVHVHTQQGLAGPPTGLLEQHRRLVVDMGGEYHDVAGDDIGAALVEFARAENATQLVLGASQRSRWAELTSGSIINRVIRLSGPIDVHVISHQAPQRGEDELHRRRKRARASPLPPRRRAAGLLLALAGVPLLTMVFAQFRDAIGLSTVLLLFLALVVATAAAGGTLAAVVAAVTAFLAANWYFTPPYHRWTIAEGENVVALSVFLGVAIVVSRFVDNAARRAAEAARARSEAMTLAGLAATMGKEEPVPALLAHLHAAFGFRGVALLRRTSTGWRIEAASGEDLPGQPDDADLVEELAPDLMLAMVGDRIAAEDQRILNAFAVQLAVVIEHGRLRVEAGRAETLAEANELRAALLQAVSHDLRTPLASIKASVTSLRQGDVEWSEEESADFLRTIDEESDRLTTLVGNLLDMSRVQAGALHPALAPVALEEVVAAALASLGSRAAIVDTHVSEDLPPVLVDEALLERALANVVDNAVRFSPPGRRVRIEAGAFSDHMDVCVADQGPGIPREKQEQVFQPFQRLGDNQPGIGVGLGLAVARGFLAAMGASIEVDATPGGGTTMVLRMATAQ